MDVHPVDAVLRFDAESVVEKPGRGGSSSGSYTDGSGSYTDGSGSYTDGSGSYTDGSGSYETSGSEGSSSESANRGIWITNSSSLSFKKIAESKTTKALAGFGRPGGFMGLGKLAEKRDAHRKALKTSKNPLSQDESRPVESADRASRRRKRRSTMGKRSRRRRMGKTAKSESHKSSTSRSRPDAFGVRRMTDRRKRAIDAAAQKLDGKEGLAEGARGNGAIEGGGSAPAAETHDVKVSDEERRGDTKAESLIEPPETLSRPGRSDAPQDVAVADPIVNSPASVSAVAMDEKDDGLDSMQKMMRRHNLRRGKQGNRVDKKNRRDQSPPPIRSGRSSRLVGPLRLFGDVPEAKSPIPEDAKGTPSGDRSSAASVVSVETSKSSKKKKDNATVDWEFCILVKDYEYTQENHEATESTANGRLSVWETLMGNGETVDNVKRLLVKQRQGLRDLINCLRSTFSNVCILRSTESNEFLSVLVGISEREAREIAKDLNVSLRLQPSAVYSAAFDSNLALANRFDVNSPVWLHLHSKYKKGKENLFEQYLEDIRPRTLRRVPGTAPKIITRRKTRFRSIDRITILDNYFESPAFRDLVDTDFKDVWELTFALHNERESNRLVENYSTWKFFQPNPDDNIASYFGIKIAYYFEYISLYTRWVGVHALFGIFVFIYQQVTGSGIDNVPSLLYCCLTILNYVVFARYNRQQQYNLSVRWGTTNAKSVDRQRRDYKGTIKYSSIDGMKKVKASTRIVCFKNFVIALMTMVTVGIIYCVLGVIILIQNMYSHPILTGLFDAALIVIANNFTSDLAVRLTEFQNPRTESEYENSLIAKLTLFKFFTGFGALYYTSFLKVHIEGSCGKDSCTEASAKLLRGIFIGMIVINNFLEIAFPRIMKSFNAWRQGGDDEEDDENEIEAQINRPDYEGVLDDYDELITQLGYSSFLSVYFPLAPLAAIVNNIVEAKVDLFKLINLLRRPPPRVTNSMGTWNIVIEAYLLITAVTNLALIAFQMTVIESYVGTSQSEKWEFLALMFVLVQLIKFIVINPLIPVEPAATRKKHEREKYLVPIIMGDRNNKSAGRFTAKFNYALLKESVENLRQNRKSHMRGLLGDRRLSSPRRRRRSSVTLADELSRQVSLNQQGQGQDSKTATKDASRKLRAFFTGSDEPVTEVKVVLDPTNRFITDIRVSNVLPEEKNDDDSCFSRWAQMLEDEGVSFEEEQYRALEVTESVRYFTVTEESDGTGCTNVKMRFDCVKEGADPVLTGICFVCPHKEFDAEIWVGQNVGGCVLETKTFPVKIKPGFHSILTSLKGFKSAQGEILQLECSFEIVKKPMQANFKFDIIQEGSRDFEDKVLARLPPLPDTETGEPMVDTKRAASGDIEADGSGGAIEMRKLR